MQPNVSGVDGRSGDAKPLLSGAYRVRRWNCCQRKCCQPERPWYDTGTFLWSTGVVSTIFAGAAALGSSLVMQSITTSVVPRIVVPIAATALGVTAVALIYKRAKAVHRKYHPPVIIDGVVND